MMHYPVADPVGADPKVYVFFAENENRTYSKVERKVGVLYCRRSSNNGVSWSAPIQVIPDSQYATFPADPSSYGNLPENPDGPLTLPGHYRVGMVWSCRDDDGGLHVVWFDNRAGEHPDQFTYPNRDLWKVYRSTSLDQGLTWSSSVLEVSTDFSLGGYGTPVNEISPYLPPGDFLSCDADADYLYIAWPDSRNYDEPGVDPGDPGLVLFRRFALP